MGIWTTDLDTKIEEAKRDVQDVLSDLKSEVLSKEDDFQNTIHHLEDEINDLHKKIEELEKEIEELKKEEK